jgi:hypothetical protein
MCRFTGQVVELAHAFLHDIVYIQLSYILFVSGNQATTALLPSMGRCGKCDTGVD